MKKLRLHCLGFSIICISFYFIAMKPASGPIHYNNQVAVLEYHHIDPQESEYTISPDRFEQQIQALKDNQYNVISMADFIEFLKGHKQVPPNAVIITFDDGYESFYKYVYPILMRQKLTATEFLIVNDVGMINTEPPFLNWDEVKEMKGNGFSFYSHTYNSHDYVPGLNKNDVNPLTIPIFIKEKKRVETEQEYENRVKNDLSTADHILDEKLGNKLDMLCYPHGNSTGKLIQLAKKEGIQYFFTGNDGLNSVGELQIKRIIAGAPYISADKLIQRLTYEPTLLGKCKALMKNTMARLFT